MVRALDGGVIVTQVTEVAIQPSPLTPGAKVAPNQLRGNPR
jgi:hypothetical protein